ncbi:MAG: orotidine-5'-phosphate decarboxylase [Variibacter sp.]|nr:orotidine-5'-phosphate decarboxylase [Variibacter sp.]
MARSQQATEKPAGELAARDRLIVALDLPTRAAAEAMIERLGDQVRFYKIGYQLAYAGGLALAEELVRGGKRVFMDLKLHDIGNSVQHGVESIARIGATFLTVHAYPQTMRAAVQGRGASALKILGVTVLTSYDDHDLAEAGYRVSVEDLVADRAHQAHDIGIDGLICSPAEAGPLRLILGSDMLLVTPGVRPSGTASNDQKRVTTPGRAISEGADYLVVGRPITAAEDPRAAAQAIVAEVAAAAGS